MVKCDKGFVEIKGSKNEVTAETAVLLRSLREHISEDEFEEVIENSKKTNDEIEAEVREVKKKIIAEILKEVLHEEDK
jgi:F0F1-type ATP synthase epsilon subunit